MSEALFAPEAMVGDADRVTTTTGPEEGALAHAAGATNPGGKEVQQDRWLLASSLAHHLPEAARAGVPEMALHGVADGHGDLGGRAAQYLVDRLPRFLAERVTADVVAQGPDAVVRAVQAAFLALDEAFLAAVTVAQLDPDAIGGAVFAGVLTIARNTHVFPIALGDSK